MQHPDEGTIHAWLDGALGADEGARLEAHVSRCAECAAAVAEARGLIAGASRVLGALDHVPAGVIPPDDKVVPMASRRRPRRWATRYGAAAALLILAAGTMYVVERSAPVKGEGEAVAGRAVQAADSVASGNVAGGSGPAADAAPPVAATGAPTAPVAPPPVASATPRPSGTVAVAVPKAAAEGRADAERAGFTAGTVVVTEAQRARRRDSARQAVALSEVMVLTPKDSIARKDVVREIAGCYEVASATVVAPEMAEATVPSPTRARARAPAAAAAPSAAARAPAPAPLESRLPARFVLDTARSTLSGGEDARVVQARDAGTAGARAEARDAVVDEVRGYWHPVGPGIVRIVWLERGRPSIDVQLRGDGVRALLAGDSAAVIPLRRCP